MTLIQRRLQNISSIGLRRLPILLRGAWPLPGLMAFLSLNKLEILCVYMSADVYELIEGLDWYDAAIAKVEASFIKTPNVIFSRHQLATRKQKAGESLEEF